MRSDLRNVFIEGMMYAVVVGMAEAYFGLLALEAGLGQVLAGLIVTVPNMLGALLALATPRVLQRVRNLRTWLLICASAQASVYVVLAASAWREWTAAAWLFGVITIYWGIVYSAATAWTTWMGLIVPSRVRTRYFARRSRAYNVVLPAAVLASGVLLNWADEPGVVGDALPWFAGVLLGAGLMRYATLWFFARTSAADLDEAHARPIPLRSVLARFGHGADGRLLLLLTAIPLARFFGEAYFTPFARDHLRLEYDRMYLLIGALFGAKALGLPIAGRVARAVGPWRVLVVSGLLLVPIPGLWMVSQSFAWLLVAQALAGMAIGAVELSGWLCVYHLIHPRDRASLWTFYQVCNTSAMAAGSLAGGWMLDAMGRDGGAYTGVFAVSMALRLLLPGGLVLWWWWRRTQCAAGVAESDARGELPGPVETEGG